MNDSVTIAWVGLGLTILVQGAAVAFFFGRLSSKTDALKGDFDNHTEKQVPQAHGCEFYHPEHSART